MNKSIFVFISVLFILCSCEKNSIEEQLLTSKCININESDVIMKFPTKVVVKDSMLYIADNKPDEYYVHVFKYPSMIYLKSLGRRGDGPNEYISLGEFIANKNHLYLFEPNKVRLDIYNTDDLSLFKSTTYPQEIRPIQSTTQYENGFITIDYSGENRLLFLDSEGNVIKREFKIINKNEEMSKLSPQKKAILHTAIIDYNSTHKMAVVASHLGEVLELYYFNDNQIEQKIVAGKGGYPKFFKDGEMMIFGTMEGYFDVKICNDKIYTIFSGLTRKEEWDLEKKGISAPNGGNKIIVYDLEGNITNKYLLDRYIYGFWIDNEQGKIIAIDNNYDDPLYYFDIPD